MKRLACMILIMALFVSGLFFVKNAYGTTVSGTINTDAHWTLMDSPVTFNGTVIVNNTVTLTIDSGVTVNLGMYGLIVFGTLNATGTASNPIAFTASSIFNYAISGINAPIGFSSTSTPWNDANNSGSIIQYANLNQIDLQISGASPKIDNCNLNFQAPYITPISINGGSPIVTNNAISETVLGYSSNVNSIIIYNGTPLISNNFFEGNYNNSTSNDITVSGGAPTISNNVFEGAYSSTNNNGIAVNSGNPLITNNQFQGRGYLNAIVDSSSTSFTISDNTFTNCVIGVQAEGGSELTVNGNSFLKGTDGVCIADGASVNVTGNLIDHNSRFGINGGGTIDSNTITNNQVGIHNPQSGTISNNNIVSNTVNSITATTASVNAENNWWGTTDTETINQTIYDSKVDPTLGTISFFPFLTQPSPTAPAIPANTPIVTPIPTILSTPAPNAIVTIITPTATPVQYSQTFIYQVGSIFNLSTIVIAIAVGLTITWIIVILGYATKKGLSRYANKEKLKQKS